MFRNIILFFVTMISCTCSYAQEDVTVTISMNKWKAMEESVFRCIYNHRTTKTNQKYPSVNL